MYRIGVDLGGTNIAAAIVDENYNIIIKGSVPTLSHRPEGEIMDDMAALCHRICAEAGIDEAEIEAVGIASPGIANHTDGIVEYSCNLPFRKYPICEEFAKRFDVATVHVENDANAAAWGEAVAGAAKGTKNSVMITLGTGVGGGIIIDNKVFSGANYAGAELGHMVISVGGRPCNCGRRGCWEAYSSATALIKMTSEKLEECKAEGRDTLMFELVEKKGKVSGRTAFQAMRAGDEAGREVCMEYVKYLASGLASMINIFQPEVLSIGGGVSGEGDYLLDMLVPMVMSEAYGAEFVKPCEIRIAKLGNDAGLIGAACLNVK